MVRECTLARVCVCVCVCARVCVYLVACVCGNQRECNSGVHAVGCALLTSSCPYTTETTRWLPNRLVRNQHAPAARGCSYTTMAPLPLPIVPMQSDAPPSQTLTEPPDARTRRARLHRDGIGANGTFNPPPLTVNPCGQATPPLTVAHGPTVATSPLCRAWLLAAASGLMPFLLAS